MAHSLARPFDVTCSRCGRLFHADVWMIVDTEERPDLRDRLVAGTLHQVDCPRCGETMELDLPLLLYRPRETPALLFSPAEQRSEAESQEDGRSLLAFLGTLLGTAWQDVRPAEGVPSVSRDLLQVGLALDSGQGPAEGVPVDALRQALDRYWQQAPGSAAELQEAFAETMETRQLLETLESLVQAETWEETRQIIEANPQLLTQAADAHLEQALKRQSDPDAVAIIREHRELLRQCREAGVESAFAARTGAKSPAGAREEQPLTPPEFAADLQTAIEASARFKESADHQALGEAMTALERIRRDPRFPNARREFRLAVLNDAATHAVRRYEAVGNPEDLNWALECWQEIVDQTPLDSPHWPRFMSNLAMGFGARYDRTSAIEDLNRAIDCLQQSIARVAQDSPALPSLQNNLGNTLRKRYERIADAADLDGAIEAYEQAVGRTHPDAPELPLRLMNQSVGWQLRYDRLGDPADLERGIRTLERALALMPPGSPARATCHNNLGLSYRYQHERTGVLEDLDRAVYHAEQAVRLTPVGGVQRPRHLNNLGAALQTRYERTEESSFLDRGIQAFQEAVQSTPPDSPELPRHLNGLGGGWWTRFRWTDAAEDLDQARIAFQEAVDRDSVGSVGGFIYRNSLAAVLLEQYRRSTDPQVLDQAIQTMEAVLTQAPQRSPVRAGCLANLAAELRERFLRTKEDSDLQHANQVSEQATVQGLESSTDTALSAARGWGDWASQRGAWDEAARAYDYARQAGDRLLQIQSVRRGKEAWLRELQGLSVLTAYALARRDDVQGAAVAFERGRARLLGEALERDRADLESVKTSDPGAYALYQLAASRLRHWETGALAAGAEPSSTAAVRPDLIASQVRQARADLDEAIQRIRRVSGHEEFFLDPDFDDIARATEPGAPLVYLLTGPAGSLALIAHRANAAAEVEVEPVWADEFTETDLWRLLLRREEGEVAGGYLPSQFAPRETLETELTPLLPFVGERLIAPLAARLRALGATKVVLVPARQLGLLPLHAASYVVDGRQLDLLEEFEVSYAPSAQALESARTALRARTDQPSILVGVGNPLPHPMPLQFAHLELAMLAGGFEEDARHLFYEREARKEAVCVALPRATHVHLACHGAFDLRQPLNAQIQLADGEPLTLAEILSQELFPRCRLVIFSACQSAITEQQRLPDESIGLPAGILQAGVPGVVGSLWAVDDLSTALLMVRFYEFHWRGDSPSDPLPMPPAGALRAAQRWLRTVTAGELAARFDAERRRPDNERTLSYEQVSALWWEFAALPAERRPFERPFHWAPFTITGV